MSLDDIVNGISESKASIEAKYLRDGRHLLEVHTIKTSKNMDNRPLIIFEFRVMDSTNELEHPINSLATLLFFGDSPGGLKAAKTALCRILCIDECDLSKNVIRNSLSPAEGKRFSPLRGLRVEAVVEYLPTKKGGRFTSTTLYSIDQDIETIDELPEL